MLRGNKDTHITVDGYEKVDFVFGFIDIYSTLLNIDLKITIVCTISAN